MGEREIHYGDILRAVERFLGRYHDAFTRSHREDIAQEAVIETWRRSALLRDPRCATAFARTVARRLRFRGLQGSRRGPAHPSLDQDPLLSDSVAVERARHLQGPVYRVQGEWIDAAWLEGQVGDVLCALGPVNRELVHGYYAGSSCAELGERYGIAAKGVKSRLQRARLRIRETFLARVRSAGRSRSAGYPDAPVPRDSEGELT